MKNPRPGAGCEISYRRGAATKVEGRAPPRPFWDRSPISIYESGLTRRRGAAEDRIELDESVLSQISTIPQFAGRDVPSGLRV